MIPLWQHAVIIVALLTAHGMTFLIFKQRIKELQEALVARRALLGEKDDDRFPLGIDPTTVALFAAKEAVKGVGR